MVCMRPLIWPEYPPYARDYYWDMRHYHFGCHMAMFYTFLVCFVVFAHSCLWYDIILCNCPFIFFYIRPFTEFAGRTYTCIVSSNIGNTSLSRDIIIIIMHSLLFRSSSITSNNPSFVSASTAFVWKILQRDISNTFSKIVLRCRYLSRWRIACIFLTPWDRLKFALH